MDFDNSWDAVLKPGKATVYFDIHESVRFDVAASPYNSGNAWWLAEMSRLVYRQGADELGAAATGPTRQEVLAAIGLEEVGFLHNEWIQCSLIGTPASAALQFKALVFRGTHDLIDWVTNLDALLVADVRGRVHAGFKKALDTLWPSIVQALDADRRPAFYTGHSLGAALATLAALRRPPQALYTFGSPLVGDKDFAAAFPRPVYRIVNNRDIVTTVPPFEGFVHVGELHYITHGGQILVDPDETTIALDRMKRDHVALLSRSHLTDAPEYLADHAPVNYVAHLERAL